VGVPIDVLAISFAGEERRRTAAQLAKAIHALQAREV
jgi:hypothetical protein